MENDDDNNNDVGELDHESGERYYDADGSRIGLDQDGENLDADEDHTDRDQEQRQLEEQKLADRLDLDLKRQDVKRENDAVTEQAAKFVKATTLTEKVRILQNVVQSAHIAKSSGQSPVATVKLFVTRVAAGASTGTAAIARFDTAVRADPQMTPAEAVRAAADAFRLPQLAMQDIFVLTNVCKDNGAIIQEPVGNLLDRLVEARAVAMIFSGDVVSMTQVLRHLIVPLRRYSATFMKQLPLLNSSTFEQDCIAHIDAIDDLVRHSQPSLVVATTLVTRTRDDSGRRRGDTSKRGFQGNCFKCKVWGHTARVCTAAPAAPTAPPPAASTTTSATMATKSTPSTSAPSNETGVKKTGVYLGQFLSPLGAYESRFPHEVMTSAVSDAPLGIPVRVASDGALLELQLAIDTGASPPIIAKSLVSKLQLPMYRSNCTAVRAIDGDVTPVLGEVCVYLQAGSAWFEMPALVLEQPVFALLAGVQWLRSQDTCILLNREAMAVSFFDDEWIPAVEVAGAAVVAIALGCEQIVADAVRAHDAAEDAINRLAPWPLPQINPTSTQIVGQPELRGEDLLAYQHVTIAPDLPQSIQDELRGLNAEYSDIFAVGGRDATSIPPCADVPPMTIHLKANADLSRVVAKYHRMAPDEQKIMDEFVRCGEEDGLLVDVPGAPCVSKAFVVRDSDGGGRVVVSFVALNQEILSNANQPPNIHDIIARMADSNYERRSAIDCKKSYYALPLAEESVPLTATLFSTSNGPVVKAFKRVPMGVKNAVGHASVHFTRIFTGGIEWRASQMLDDTDLIHATDEHVVPETREHYARARATGMTLNAKKTRLGFRKMEMLGKIVGPGTIEARADYMQGIRDHARPRTRKQLQSWLGLLTSVLSHLPGVRDTLAVLESEKGKRGPFVWTDEMEVAFIRSKELCESPEVCAPFDPTRHLFVLTDASAVGGSVIFAHLSLNESHFELINTFSMRWNQAQKAYHASQGEFVMLRYALEKAPELMCGRPLFWVCDTLTMAQAMKSLHVSPSPRVRRTLAELSELTVFPIHVPGVQNKIADALSRNPAWMTDDDTSTTAVVAAGVAESDEAEEGEVLSDSDDDSDVDDSESKRVANPLQRVGHAPKSSPPSDEDEPDMFFKVPDEPIDAWRARWRARTLDDPALSDLRALATEREEQRVAGLDVADNESRVVWPDWGPDGLLYVQVGGQEFHCIVVPNGCRNEVLHAAHAGAGVSHWSVRRMIATLRRWFFWSSMYGDAAKWCKQCVPCQRRRVLEESARLGDSEEAGEPSRLQQWQIDSFHIGGMLFAVSVELFAGKIWIHPVRDATSASMAHAVESSLFVAFGVPEKIRTDGGPEFAGAFQALCTAYGVDLETGQANNPRSQAVVERALRTLRDGVTALQVQGSTAPIDVLVARVAIAINAAPSDDEWHIAPDEMLLGRVVRPVPIVRYIDPGLAGLAPTSKHQPLKELLDEQERIFNALASLRHQQRQKERAKHVQAFEREHRADGEPVIGELRWAILPLDLKKQGKDDTRRRATLIRITAFNAVNGRVEGVLELDAPSPAAPARVVVNARRTWPFEKFKSIDDVALIDDTVLPRDWETRVAPLGGLARPSKGAMQRLLQAQKARAKQDVLSAAELAKAKADDERRAVVQAAADAKAKAAAAKAERDREAAAVEERRRVREVVEVLQKRFLVGDVVGEYLIRRRDGLEEWMRRNDSQLPTDVVERFNLKMQQQHRDERALRRQQGRNEQGAGVVHA